jgi:hypothetical protein
MVRLHEVLNKVQNPLTSGWGPGVIWTFVQGINNNVSWDLAWEIEHAVKALCEGDLAGLF